MNAKQRSNRPRRVVCAGTFISLVLMIIFGCSQSALAQATWNTNGNDISNANSGNVGVGTTTPVSALHVATESTVVPRGISNAQHSSDGNSPLLIFFKSRGTKLSPSAVINGDGLGNLQSQGWDGSSYITTARFKFGVDGTVSSGSVPTSLQFFTGSNASGIERMRISSSGNIGIGTTAPEVRLSVHHSSANTNINATQLADLGLGVRNTSNTNGNMSLISFQDSTGFGNAHVGAIQTNQTNHSADLVFLTRNSGTLAERLRIKSDGNVGIGTSSPFYKLHAASGTDTFTNLLFLDTAVHGGSLFGVGGNTNNESYFALHVYRGGQYFNRLYVDNFGRLSLSPNGDGNVGVGTAAPNYRFDVQGGQINSSGGLCIAGDCKTAWSQVGGGTSQWTTNGTSIFYNTGNVGIGTSTPGVALDVSQNKAIRVGHANLSSGGDYVHLANHAWYNGSAWQLDGAAGGLYQISVQQHNWYAHNGAGSFTNLMQLNANGNLGLGTTAPTAKLHVAGDGKVTGNLTVDGNIAAKYQDVAEWVPAVQALPPGTVVTLNRSQSNLVEASSKAYDTRVAGVVSEKPGLALGEQGENKLLIATTGRVRIKVDATNAAIEIGDLLVTSEKEGIAMKSVPVTFGGIEMHRPGTLIGKALEPLAKGQGEILVLLSLQ